MSKTQFDDVLFGENRNMDLINVLCSKLKIADLKISRF